MNMNQGLLISLDVTHPRLEMICAMAFTHSYAAKLTGAGGGGYAYVCCRQTLKTNPSIFLKRIKGK